jgi:hypothetical protein
MRVSSTRISLMFELPAYSFKAARKLETPGNIDGTRQACGCWFCIRFPFPQN